MDQFFKNMEKASDKQTTKIATNVRKKPGRRLEKQQKLVESRIIKEGLTTLPDLKFFTILVKTYILETLFR